MDGKRKERAVELLKDMLIVLLTCSALWLAARTPLAGPLRALFHAAGAPHPPGPAPRRGGHYGPAPRAWVPTRPGVAGLSGAPEGAEGARCGIRYDQTACQELFQRIAGPLVEALSSAGAPERITRRQWEEALTTSLGVYMDFQGEIPLPVLVGWLSGGKTELTAAVRRMALSAGEDGVDLYYREGEKYFRCRSEVADPFPLVEALSGLMDNGAFFAFESELYRELDPDTLLLPNAPSPAVYTAANPMVGAQGTLQSLVRDIGFSVNSTSFYSTDEQVARSGDDSVRLSAQGVAQYQYEGKGGGGLFPVLRQGEGSPLFDAVETCRQTALSALGPRCGEARLYLLSVAERPEGWEIDFGYSLNGVPVLLEAGRAARFLVERGQIVQFSLCLRSYANSGSTSLVLPPRQGAAALLALGLEGEELLLAYADSGGDTVSALWAAAGNGEG